MTKTIYAHMEYLKKGVPVKKDICTIEKIKSLKDCEEAFAILHTYLDKWLDNSKGTGFFIVKQKGYPRIEKSLDLTETYKGIDSIDLKMLARIQVLMQYAAEHRSDGSVEGSFLVEQIKDVFDKILVLSTQLALGMTDSNAEHKIKEKYEQYKHEIIDDSV